MRIFTSEQTRQAEENAVAMGMNWLRLMENAGAAASRVIREKFSVKNKNVAIICGRGNNGGDGYVVARKLNESGAKVTVIQSNGAPGTPTAFEMYRRITAIGIPVIEYKSNRERAEQIIKSSEIIVDGIFGIGFYGEVAGDNKKLIEIINGTHSKVVSLDVPSGADCDTGAVNGVCVKADLTVSFTAYKPCHVMFPACEYCGEVVAVSIGMPAEAVDSISTSLRSIEMADVLPNLRVKKRNTHKGDFGTALLICGSLGMSGATAIAAKSAIRTGAGLVKAVVPKSIYCPLASSLYEPVFRVAPETDKGVLSAESLDLIFNELEGSTAVLIGCGLGRDENITQIVKELITKANRPIVLDADGINAICGCIDIIKQAKAPLILTPHPGEMARMLNTTSDKIQAARLKTARDFATEYGVYLVLKGSGTIVALPDGRAFVNLTGNYGMSSAGSGDMLAGMLVSLLAQGLTPEQAAVTSVYLHGHAGDRAAAKLSKRSMSASDMIDELPLLFHEIETAG